MDKIAYYASQNKASLFCAGRYTVAPRGRTPRTAILLSAGCLLFADEKCELALGPGRVLNNVSDFPNQIGNIDCGQGIGALDSELIAGCQRLQYLARAHRGQWAFKAPEIDRFLQSPGPFFP